MIDKKIENKKDCTGCHACMSICPVDCISMDCDEEGFLYPKVNYEICIGCNRCITVCPMINKPTENDNAEAYTYLMCAIDFASTKKSIEKVEHLFNIRNTIEKHIQDNNFDNWDKQKQEEYLGSEKTQRKIMCYPTNIRICEND